MNQNNLPFKTHKSQKKHIQHMQMLHMQLAKEPAKEPEQKEPQQKEPQQKEPQSQYAKNISNYLDQQNHVFFNKDMMNEYCLNDRTNKRSDLNNKLADRHLMTNFVSNPFLSNNSYIEDLNNQEKFLKPQNNYKY
jgi:hypothetical protein